MKKYHLLFSGVCIFVGSCSQTANTSSATINDSVSPVSGKDSNIAAIPAVVETIGATDSTYAYIKSVKQTADSVFIDADYIQFLTGNAALAAAEKNHEADTMRDDKGKITGIIVDDDYYILNESKKIRTLPVSADAGIEIVDMSSGPVSTKKTTLKDFIQKHGHDNFPFILKFKNNIVTEITEMYVP